MSGAAGRGPVSDAGGGEVRAGNAAGRAPVSDAGGGEVRAGNPAGRAPVSDAARLEACVAAGGVAAFPSDTVYGLACDPEDRAAVERLYALKRRDPAKASAVMFFAVEPALAAMPELGERTVRALRRLLPGGVTLLLPNPARRFALAAAADPQTLGLRVPAVPGLAAVGRPVLQSSANLAGAADPRTLSEVPLEIRAAVDLVIDGGELPGTPSTVIDLRRYEAEGAWEIVRPGAMGAAALAQALDWDPTRYAREIRAEIPDYERLQQELVAASGDGARRILELGTGTGETARRLLARHSQATLTGIDASAEMLDAARAGLPAERAALLLGRLEEPLPPGPFDLVASALCVHHLPAAEKAALFRRVAAVLAPGGRFVLADVVVPEDPARARIELTTGYDLPSSVADQLAWLEAAGLRGEVRWSGGDLAVIAATSST